MSKNANESGPNTGRKRAPSLPQPVRWTIQAGAMDFAIDEKTLAARLNRAGTLPGKDKRYSTAQIAAAVFGDLRQAQTRLAAAQADAAEVEAAKVSGELLPWRVSAAVAMNTLASMLRIIEMSPLPKEDVDKIRVELSSLKVSDLVTDEILKTESPPRR